MVGIVIALVIITWLIAAFYALGSIEPIRISLKVTAHTWVIIFAIILSILTVGCVILGLRDNEAFYANLATSFGSVAVTIFVLDRLNEGRALERRKQEIFEELESPVRDVAVEAIRLARKYGWLDEALAKVNLRGAQLERADLRGANLQETGLREANLEKADLSGANLQRAIFLWAHLEGADLRGAQLQEANLHSAHLEEADLTGVNLRGANLVYANLQGANLWAAHLEGADLNGANLQRARLQGANLQGAFLINAHLEEADLNGAKLEEAHYNLRTAWPEDFDPVAAGAIFTNFDGE